jgi:hypothetical protein
MEVKNPGVIPVITKRYDDKELCVIIMMKMWTFRVEVEMAKERKASGWKHISVEVNIGKKWCK